mgnify:CR=1 FL=1
MYACNVLHTLATSLPISMEWYRPGYRAPRDAAGAEAAPAPEGPEAKHQMFGKAAKMASVVGHWLATGPERALVGTQAALVRKASWSFKFWTAVNALKGGAWAVARDVDVCRMLTDHAIPKVLVPAGVRIETKVLAPAEGSDAELVGEMYTCTHAEYASTGTRRAATIIYAHGGAYCC